MSGKTPKQQPLDVVKDHPVATMGKALGIGPNIGASEIRLPRIALTQALSPSVVDGTHRSGLFINTLTGKEIPHPVVILPAYLFRNVIRWKPRAEGGGMIYKTLDITPEVAKDLAWDKDIKPLATAYINAVSIVEGQEMPLVASFCNTSYKAGLTLSTLVQLYGCAWKYKYVLTAKAVTNAKGSFFEFAVKQGESATKSEAEEAYALYEMMKGFATIDTDYEGDTTTPEAEVVDPEEGV